MAKGARTPIVLAVSYLVLFGAASAISPFLAIVLGLPWTVLFDGPSDYQSGLSLFYLCGLLNAVLIFGIASLVSRSQPAVFKCGKCGEPISPGAQACPSCGFVFGE